MDMVVSDLAGSDIAQMRVSSRGCDEVTRHKACDKGGSVEGGPMTAEGM